MNSSSDPSALLKMADIPDAYNQFRGIGCDQLPSARHAGRLRASRESRIIRRLVVDVVLDHFPVLGINCPAYQPNMLRLQISHDGRRKRRSRIPDA